MDILGKLNLFVRDIKDPVDDKTVYRHYYGSVGKKDEDGKWHNIEVEVRFAKDSKAEINLRPLKTDYIYIIEVLKGFFTFDYFVSTVNNKKTEKQIPVFVVSDHKVLESKKIEDK